MTDHEREFWRLRNECVDKAMRLAGPDSGVKSQDYNSSGVTILDYADCGVVARSAGFFPDIWKKTMRLRSLLGSNKKPNCESIKDNLVDLLNYVSFQYALFALYGEVLDDENNDALG
jgi:hypothetical protein